MNESAFVSSFEIVLVERQHYHTAGHISFSKPCIGYLLKGSGEFLYRGNTYIANKGDLIYIAPGTKYYSVWRGNPEISFYSIHFSYSNHAAFQNYRFQILKNYHCLLPDKIFSTYSTDRMESIALFYLLLSDIYKQMTVEEKNPKFASVEKAIEYIENNYSSDISVSMLSDMCHLSEPRFYALFREVTEVSPINYKHNIMIQHALNLLGNSDLSIEEISREVGFSSSNYFRTVFHKITKMTPKQARAYRSKENNDAYYGYL